jgi:CheY-like chemotaxis protein
MSQARLLIVDDAGVSRSVLGMMLGRMGFATDFAKDGAEALSQLAAAAFDLILLDVRMPGMDGFEVLERLKADPLLKEIPVVMISGLDDMPSIVRCVKLGAEDFVFKPYDEVLLRLRIDACLERRRLRREQAERT